jgi:YVTN family beta-propeller protein
MKTRRPGGILAVVGAALLSLASLAHAAPFAYVPQSATSTVAVVDTATGTIVATVPVGSNPFGVAVHPSGTRVYVGNTDDNSVSVIDVASNTVVATVPVQTGPAGLAVHPDGSRLFVANELDDTVTVIETAGNTVAGTVMVGDGPRGVAVNAAGTRLYVANNLSFNVSVVDTATMTVVATVPVGERPVGVAVHPAGTRVYVTNATSSSVSVLNAANNTLASTIQMASMSNPFGVAVHPAGTHVYVANGSGRISVIATVTDTVVATPMVAPGLFGIAVTSSGAQVYAVNQGAGVVYVLDTASNTVTGQVAVPDEPTAFGAFITPSAGGGCDTAELEKALAAAQAQATALQADNQSLIADNGRLQGDLTAVSATIDSFLDKLFGEGLDGKIAAAARAVALTDLNAARAAAPSSWRVRLAQQSFDQGDKAMRRHDWHRAVREFREVHAIVEWILGDRRIVPTAPTGSTAGTVAAVAGTPSAGSGCDTTELEKTLAAALRQVASLQAANQSLTAENLRLRSELATAKATVTSFVMRLFGEGSDGNVAAAARDAAKGKLNAAQAAAPHDRRLRSAQQSFDHGLHLMRKQDWGRSVHEFRETHELAERILKDKYAHRHGRW